MAEIRLARHEIEKNLLPMICVRCGAPATSYESKRLSCGPTWMWLLVMLGMAVSFVFGLLTYAAGHNVLAQVILWGGVLLSVMLGQRLIPYVNLHLPWCTAHRSAWHQTSIEAHNITDEGFILGGVSEEFARTVLLASSPNSLISADPPDPPIPSNSSHPPRDQFFDPER
jgi:hypothetical protein